jgi:ligand-binding sensor domain-containing protein
VNPHLAPIGLPSKANAVWSMMQDRHGTIWIGTHDGVFTYDGASFSRFPQGHVINPQRLQLKMIGSMLEDGNGVVWFASGMPPGGEGVIRFDGKSLRGEKPNGDGWIRTMVREGNGTLWFGGRHNGNFTFDGKAFGVFKEKTGIGAPLLADSKGNLWFAGGEHDNGYSGINGIWLYDDKAFKNFGPQDGLGDYGVWLILEDRAGRIWVGTRNNGLYRFDPRAVRKQGEKSFACFSE